MVRLRDNLLALSAIGLLVSCALLAVVFGYTALVAVSALAAGTPLVGVLVDVGVAIVPVVGVLTVAAVLSAVGLVWASIRRLARFRSRRLQVAFERIEAAYPPLARYGMSEAVAPPEPSAEERAERALDALKRRYVAGEIDEAEFERRLDRLADDETVREAVSGEREAAAASRRRDRATDLER